MQNLTFAICAKLDKPYLRYCARAELGSGGGIRFLFIAEGRGRFSRRGQVEDTANEKRETTQHFGKPTPAKTILCGPKC